jgi:molecular chaperone HscB
MEYFKLFEIPVQLKVESSGLSKKYFELSKKYHPDYYANEIAEVQAEILEKSALINKALKTFKNPDETIKYVLMEKGLLLEEEKYELPPDFLMEVMDINEQLMERDENTDVDPLNSLIAQLSADIYEPVKGIIENYQEAVTTNEELLRVKEYYYKKKYLDRIREQMAGMA